MLYCEVSTETGTCSADLVGGGVATFGMWIS